MNKDLKKYFKNMFKDIDSDIELDEDQIKAITNDDNHVLVLAGAGTGKTTTMVGKVKYLVDIKNVDPSRILVISYTKKAVEELRSIINDGFDLNTPVTTFHSLAFKYVRKNFENKKCIIVDHNLREKIFYNYMNKLFKENKVKDLIDTFNSETLNNKHFVLGNYFLANYDKYEDYDSFFNAFKVNRKIEAEKYGLRNVIDTWKDDQYNNDEHIISIKGEAVKSVAEGKIANFLYEHGINYEYEKVYDRIVEDRKTYRPDFTLDMAGHKVYLEYFGINDEDYNKIKQLKIKLHKKHHNDFIYLDNTRLDQIEKELDRKLKEFGFEYNDRSDEEIFDQILNNNKLSQVYKIKNLFYKTIIAVKQSIKRENYLNIINDYIKTSNDKDLCQKQFDFFDEFRELYKNHIYTIDTYGFEYDDLIYYANKALSEGTFIDNEKYDYIIIDEYQDISDGEYKLARNILDNNKCKIFAVGDDWQSIYSFRGSKIKYITKFDEYFEKPTVVTIRKTYRYSQELGDIAGTFIMENKDQLKKNIISVKHLSKPVHFVYYEVPDNYLPEVVEYKELEELINKIHEKNPNHRVLVLARTNEVINNCFKYNTNFIDSLGTEIQLRSVYDIKLDAMTMHKSKGLTFDEVIIIGMNKDFPRDNYSDFWIIQLFKHEEIRESVPYAEERRLLYVALTRTKNNVYILANKKARERSRYVDELIKICSDYEKKASEN